MGGETRRIRVGTSGWSYRHWRGVFYPGDEPQRTWFDHYTAHFDTVEVNSTFYHPPSEPTCRAWRDRAPERFVFALKASRRITHSQRLADVAFHHTTSQRLFSQGLIDRPVGVYFYDGDHSRAGTYHGMVAAAPYLSERAVVLVDDWNDPTIRAATVAGLRDSQLHVLWQRELHGDHTVRSWWNGLGVFFVEKGRDGAHAFGSSRRPDRSRPTPNRASVFLSLRRVSC